MLFLLPLALYSLFVTLIAALPQSFAPALTQIASPTGTIDKVVNNAKFAYNAYKILEDQANKAEKQISKVSALQGSLGTAAGNA
ncbi:hypothetical protein VTP01DRAFT_9389 [Rhizomucor pusillus]|uniref:uncharacterized protein n=1 Tax=Rhizomucor pusillus TaxID=4840 RepID=UPI00374416E0